MKVMATGITHLTDARYFAAQLVDYMVFDASLVREEGIAIIKEIQQWIDGVVWLIEYNEHHQVIDFLRQETGIDGAISSDPDLLVSFKQKFLRSNQYSAEVDALVIAEAQEISGIEDQTVYLEIGNTWPTDELPTGISGIVLRGSQEDKIGFKSYDELDKIFSLLEASSTGS